MGMHRKREGGEGERGEGERGESERREERGERRKEREERGEKRERGERRREERERREWERLIRLCSTQYVVEILKNYPFNEATYRALTEVLVGKISAEPIAVQG
jgi:hypothetical protein